MQINSQIASSAPPSAPATRKRSSEDLIYQVITVFSALMLLGSLWAF